MSEPSTPNVISGERVRRVTQPVIVNCGSRDSETPMTVVPLVDGDVIAGLEVHCRCGADLLIECVYEEDR